MSNPDKWERTRAAIEADSRRWRKLADAMEASRDAGHVRAVRSLVVWFGMTVGLLSMLGVEPVTAARVGTGLACAFAMVSGVVSVVSYAAAAAASKDIALAYDQMVAEEES